MSDPTPLEKLRWEAEGAWNSLSLPEMIDWIVALAARVERETREADAQLVDSCSLGNHGLVRLLDDDKTLRPVASAIRSTPTIYQEPDMSEKPKPVDAWGLFMRGKKIPFEVFETKQAAIWRAEVFHLDYNETARVIPVTITAKEE